MKFYKHYIQEIEDRKKLYLKPKPIDDGNLLKEIITEITNVNSKHREKCLNFLIFNTLPGTTSAAKEKSRFLKKMENHRKHFSIKNSEETHKKGTKKKPKRPIERTVSKKKKKKKRG